MMARTRWRRARLPVTAFVVVWAAAYSTFYPPENYLWTCNVALLLAAAALWLPPTRLLLSTALILAAVADAGWVLDVSVAAATGQHPIGGTEYMFRPDIPWYIRLLSFEHALLTPLLLWLLWPAGYDRRALPLVVAAIVPLYYLTWLVGDPYFGVNWVWGLFGRQQTWVAPPLYPAIAAAIFVLVVVVPGHVLASRLIPLAVGAASSRDPTTPKATKE